MSLLESIKNLFGGAKKQSGVPQEMIEKVQNLAESNAQMVEEVGEQIKDAIPGNTGDQVVDAVTDKLTGK